MSTEKPNPGSTCPLPCVPKMDWAWPRFFLLRYATNKDTGRGTTTGLTTTTTNIHLFLPRGSSWVSLSITLLQNGIVLGYSQQNYVGIFSLQQWFTIFSRSSFSWYSILSEPVLLISSHWILPATEYWQGFGVTFWVFLASLGFHFCFFWQSSPFICESVTLFSTRHLFLWSCQVWGGTRYRVVSLSVVGTS
jgi:hypothetical protein